VTLLTVGPATYHRTVQSDALSNCVTSCDYPLKDRGTLPASQWQTDSTINGRIDSSIYCGHTTRWVLSHNLYVKINTIPSPLSPFNTCLAFHNIPRGDTLLFDTTITASAAGRAAAEWHFYTWGSVWREFLKCLKLNLHPTINVRTDVVWVNIMQLCARIEIFQRSKVPPSSSVNS